MAISCDPTMRQIGADVISYNAAISACNAGGEW